MPPCAPLAYSITDDRRYLAAPGDSRCACFDRWLAAGHLVDGRDTDVGVYAAGQGHETADGQRLRLGSCSLADPSMSDPSVTQVGEPAAATGSSSSNSSSSKTSSHATHLRGSL